MSQGQTLERILERVPVPDSRPAMRGAGGEASPAPARLVLRGRQELDGFASVHTGRSR